MRNDYNVYKVVLYISECFVFDKKYFNNEQLICTSNFDLPRFISEIWTKLKWINEVPDTKKYANIVLYIFEDLKITNN